MKKKSRNKKDREFSQEDITRKEAIKKVGKYATVTAASMLVVLHPKKAQAGSPPEPGGGW